MIPDQLFTLVMLLIRTTISIDIDDANPKKGKETKKLLIMHNQKKKR